MKRLLFLMALSFASHVHAQMWLDVGLKGGYNSTWLLSQNVLNDQYVKMGLNFAPTGGLKLGLNFNEQYSLALEGVYVPINQTTNSQGLSSTNWSSETKLNYMSIPLLFRNSKGGSYIEIGPQISVLTAANESYNSNAAGAVNYSNTSAKNAFESVNYAAVFGFGSYIASFTENLYLTLGFRAAYGLNDIINSSGGAGQDYRPKTPDGNGKTQSYTLTHSLVIGFNMELDFDLGYLVSAHCGRKQFLLFN